MSAVSAETVLLTWQRVWNCLHTSGATVDLCETVIIAPGPNFHHWRTTYGLHLLVDCWKLWPQYNWDDSWLAAAIPNESSWGMWCSFLYYAHREDFSIIVRTANSQQRMIVVRIKRHYSKVEGFFCCCCISLDVILCGWLDSKHQPTNCCCCCPCLAWPMQTIWTMSLCASRYKDTSPYIQCLHNHVNVTFFLHNHVNVTFFLQTLLSFPWKPSSPLQMTSHFR